MKFITNNLLSIEEKARKHFEKYPFLQAFLAGMGVIIFWRGVWEIMDVFKIDPILSIIIGMLMLLGIGLFIQTFMGNTLIIKSVKKEEKLEKEILKEITNVEEDEVVLQEISEKLNKLLVKMRDDKTN
jgi:hypothetical protein